MRAAEIPRVAGRETAFMTGAPHFPIVAGPTLLGAARLLASADLPTSDLSTSQLQHFFYLGSADLPTGLVGLELYGKSALLRSLIVAPAARASGAGTALVQYAESHARSHGIRDLYLLTTTAEEFFGQRGYSRAARETAPESIRSTREFADICPASSTLMVKHL